ncbi:hypothetical protein T265_16339, partial [Opisthorchis viverrini]
MNDEVQSVIPHKVSLDPTSRLQPTSQYKLKHCLSINREWVGEHRAAHRRPSK